MAKVTMKMKKENLAEILTANAGEVLTEELAAEITGVFVAGPAVSNKIDEDGNIYCTYFKTHLPAEDFTASKSGKIGAMSDAGKRLFRKQKSAVNKAVTEVMKNFRAKDISGDEMAALLDDIDANAGHRYELGTEDIGAEFPYEV